MITHVSQIVSAHKGCYFSKSTMRFFRSRLSARVHDGPGGIFFVTSEKRTGFSAPDGPRLYSVRQFFPETHDIQTAGEFQGFKSAKTAHTQAARLAQGG